MEEVLKKAIENYESNLAAATKCGEELMRALKNAEQVSGSRAEEVFKQQAERALVAHENWRKAAQNALEVVRSIRDTYNI